MGCEFGGKLTFGMFSSSGRVRTSCAPETASFRGVTWVPAEVLGGGAVPKVLYH
jgi:hypothetical protein